MSDPIRCFRSKHSEWIIDAANDRYIRRPRPDVEEEHPSAVRSVPYDDPGWHPMVSWGAQSCGGNGQLTLVVRDPSLEKGAMTTSAVEVMP